MINIFENSIEKKYSFYELVDEQYQLFGISLGIPTSASHVPPRRDPCTAVPMNGMAYKNRKKFPIFP